MVRLDMSSPVMMISKKHDDGQPACMGTSFTTRAAETTADPNYGVWNRRDDQEAPAEILKAAQDTRRFIHEKTDDCLEAHSFFVRKKRESAMGTTPPAKQKKKRKLTDEAKRRLELQQEWSICCDACDQEFAIGRRFLNNFTNKHIKTEAHKDRVRVLMKAKQE